MGSCSYDDTGSSSLPPLMDSYITFDQTQPFDNFHDDDGDDEQVPCFSIFSSQQHPHQMTTTNPNIFSHLEQPNMNTARSTFGKIPVAGSACLDLDSFSCDTKVIKAVLNQLTKIESNDNIVKESPPSFGDPSSELSYLSVVGMPTNNMWNHF